MDPRSGLRLMPVAESVADSRILGSFSSAGGLCSNSNCIKMAQTKCTKCELRYCYEHSKHPEHR